MIHYVVGLAFDETASDIVLLLKDHGPVEVVGKWTGPGGKVNRNEGMIQAMQREFQEETGVFIEEWDLLCSYWSFNRDYRINFYTAFDDAIYEVSTQETETVEIFPVSNVAFGYNLPTVMAIPIPTNLKWLIPMALDNDIKKPVTIENIEE